ncbi:MAG: CC0125/CC1285 family lipoprotein [Sphingomonas sp.]
MATLSKPRRAPLLAALAATTLMLAGCETATTYHPATGHGFGREGYSEQRIESNRFQITFSGNGVTSRDTVERYLLYRAAELTVQNGYDYFTLVDRNTERKSRTYVNEPFRPGPWGYWGVSWRYHRPGFGWGFYDPFWGPGPFDRDIDISTIDRYEAHAEIVMGRGAPPAGDVHTFDARQVMQNLGPTIRMPGQEGARR